MKIELDETIEIFPKILLFNKFPSIIDDEMLVNFLKLDILLLEDKKNGYLSPENILASIIDADEYLFNEKDSVMTENECERVVNEKKISGINQFVISSRNNLFLEDAFIKFGIPFFCRKDSSKDELINIIKEIINASREQKEYRSSLRILFKPKSYKAEIHNGEIKCDCFIIDLSFGGLCLEMTDVEEMKKIHIGSFFAVSLDLYMTEVEILRAVVIRKDYSRKIISIKINTGDKYEIDEENTKVLESVISVWIKKIVRSHLLEGVFQS